MAFTTRTERKDAALNNFGPELKKLRKKRDVTQYYLAEKAGVDVTYISKMENGQLKHYPSVETITKIAEVLDADADKLILLAKKIPKDIEEIIVKHGDDLMFSVLRKLPSLNEEKKKEICRLINENDEI